MKKKVLFVAAIFTATFGMAQDLTSKKGETILPEAGDYAIGFDANPFLNYFGNMFNSQNNSAFSANFTNGQAITGKMFTDANNAYRFGVRVGINTSTDNFFVQEAGSTDPTDLVEDEVKSTSFALNLSFGKEMRRGNTRLQGFYGAEGMLSLGSSVTKYEYGNDIEDLQPDTTRPVELNPGTTFGVGARGFVGVEYFIAPKISIAAEYGWGLMISTTAEGENTTESNTAANGVEENTIDTGSSNAFSLDTDVSGGSIKVLFHF